jgi:1,4-dihydroxy-2-naphthoyl-CoA synthase
MAIADFIGQNVNVVVTLENGKSDKKLLKVCKANTRSVLFIEVDKPNRKNIFRKVSIKDIMNVVNDDTSGNNVNSVYMKKGVLLSQNKWESSWDSIGNKTISGNTYGYRSTTNSRAGFPMV